ncbi:hypothetical protein FSP39_008384 [Pinctada imbricata]|uniref:Integrin alpha-2 domain-containing protein n=1 Tax=Pinctada imbricata TaxID=66713 RepID=A0AA89C706_PINIB|nr:hypothetical protein FSP39_008384 [Pinctada imbricata]
MREKMTICDTYSHVVWLGLLVGAPRYENQALLTKTGGLYRCDAQTATGDCQFLSTLETNLRKEGNGSDGQWLGSTVTSKGRGGLAMVCAFRYHVNYNPLGRCVLLDEALNFKSEIRQCQDDGRENEGTAYCQAGASAQVLPDDELFLGAPGAHDWTGRVSKIYQGRQFGKDKSWKHSSSEFPVPQDSGLKIPPIDKNSYMGFSVVAGKFKGYNYDRMYVGGAPRSNSTGQVVLFFNSLSGLDYFENQVIDGEQPFSAFGYDITAVDFDNDGFDELVVGSPMYVETKERYVGGAVYVYNSDTQLNAFSNYVKLVQPMSEKECMKVKCLDARFGHTVSPAGDVNLDGYHDLVIGAPYDNKGRGAIYIYHGSKMGIIEKYSQKITPSELPPSLSSVTTFGHALTGGLDMDNNGYPDIAVGAYGNDTAILLRTRPILHLTSQITVNPPKFNINKVPGCQFDDPRLVLEPKHCVQLLICLNFSAKPYESFTTNQTIKVKVIAEKDEVNKRVYFKGPLGMNDKQEMVEFDADLLPRSSPRCFNQTVYMEDLVKDQLTPISFHVNYSLAMDSFPDNVRKKRQSSTLPDINKYPVLMTDGSVGGNEVTSTVMVQVDFVKKCGKDEICQSRLSFDMMPKLELNKDNGEYMLSYGVDKEFELEVVLRNNKEPAYEPTLYVMGGADLKFLRSEYLVPEINLVPCEGQDRIVKCEFRNPFGDPEKVDNDKIRIKLRFGTSELDPSIPRFNITAIFNTTSEEETPEDDEQHFFINVVTRADIQVIGVSTPSGDVIYQGRIRGESAIEKEDQIGPAINHTYTIFNQGKGTIGSADLLISWPYEKVSQQYERGKWILYLLQVAVTEPRNEKKASCEHNPDILNPLGYKTSAVIDKGPEYTIVSRRRREVDTEGSTTKGPGATPTNLQKSPERENKGNIVELCNFFKRLKPDGGYEPTYSGDLKKTKDMDYYDY